MWGHVGISIGNRNFLFFRKQSYYRMDGRADLGLFYIFFEVTHLNMNNIFWNFGAFTLKGKLGGGFKYFLFSTLFGEMIQFD